MSHGPSKPHHDKHFRRRILARTSEILGLVVSHGFGYILDTPERRQGHWKKILGKPTQTTATRTNRWTRIRRLLEDLGPTFIKMGQMFSNRPDLLPEELLVELRKLQENVPGLPFEAVRSTIESELGQSIEEVFERFEAQPVACASIAQVHQAYLAGGQKVAVKVMRPGIEELVQVDLEILSHIGRWFEKIVLRSDVIDTGAILHEFQKTITKEMDFKNEGLYLEKFAMNFKGDADILVPQYYKKISTKRVLVMEFVDGIKPLDWDAYTDAGLSRKTIAERGAKLVLKQIFVHGFFHADPHPGNIIILPDGRISFIDFGMMGVIFERYREKLAEMLLAVSTGDAQTLTKALIELAQKPDLDDPTLLEEDVFTLLETFSHLPLSEIDLTEFLQKTVSIILHHKLDMPPSLYLLLKAMITIEGFARQLDPDFDLLSQLEPFIRQVFESKLNPLKASGKSAESALNYLSLAADLPTEIRETLKLVKRGKLKLEFDQNTLDQILHKADRISNRLSFSLIVTGGIVASSMALQSKIPPLWNDIPVIAIVGYIGSALLGLALLISIWRSGRL